MKINHIKYYLLIISFSISFQSLNAQPWFTNLDVAQKLAFVQDKLVLMVWEESTTFDYAVFANNDKGHRILIKNLFLDEAITPVIWKYFVPVIVNESEYNDWYNSIKKNHGVGYLNKFNDDSIKILDVNGFIINANSSTVTGIQNISKIIQEYAVNTSFVKDQIDAYRKNKTEFNAYYLASKYMDFSMYLEPSLRMDFIKLSSIYINEAIRLSKDEGDIQRCNLLKIKQELYLKKPKKVIRKLNRIGEELIFEKNYNTYAMLYYIAYESLSESVLAEQWKAKLSSVLLKASEQLIQFNKK